MSKLNCFVTGGLQAQTQQSQHPIQLVQQIVTPNGEIQHMPVVEIIFFNLKIKIIRK